MELSELTRDKAKVLEELADDEQSTVARKPCWILVPTTWRNANLAIIGQEIHIAGYYMLLSEDGFYAVSNAACMVRITPSSMSSTHLAGKEYIVFEFDAGETLFPTKKVVKDNKLVYSIFNEFIAKGRVPAYMDYTDLGKIFDTTKYYAGVNLSSTPTIIHAMVSVIARDPDNPQTYFRHVSSGDDLGRVKFIPMKTSIHAATNTTARMVGAHFSDNLDSALLNPSDREEAIESYLRM